MSNIIEKSKYQEAYRCETGHVIPKWRQYGNFPAMDSMAFHACCPECGSKNISIVTGIWEREYIMTGNLFGKARELVKEQFIESIFSYHDRKKKGKDILVDESVESIIKKDFEFAFKMKEGLTGNNENVLKK